MTEYVTYISQNITQIEWSLSVSLEHMSILTGSRFSVLNSNLTLTLELFQNTDDRSAPREIFPQQLQILTYSNAYPIKMH